MILFCNLHSFSFEQRLKSFSNQWLFEHRCWRINKFFQKRFIFKIENFIRCRIHNFCQIDRIFVHELRSKQRRVFLMMTLMKKEKQKTNSIFRMFLMHFFDIQLIVKFSNVMIQSIWILFVRRKNDRFERKLQFQVNWSLNQASSSNESTWFDLQVEDFDLNLSLSQVQILDTLKDLNLNQVSSRNVKIWFEFNSNFKFRYRIWFDSSRVSTS